LIVILKLLFIAFSAEALTEIAVKDKITAPFREYLQKKSKILNGVLSCGRCFSFWATCLISSIVFFTPFYWIFFPIIAHRAANFTHDMSDFVSSRHRQFNYMVLREIEESRIREKLMRG